MLRPINGATVSGSVPLDASVTAGLTAADARRVTKVEFYLTGHSQNQTLIAKGSLTLVGWAARWNSTKVANGNYTLHSVAYDALGRRSRSKSIRVKVSN